MNDKPKPNDQQKDTPPQNSEEAPSLAKEEFLKTLNRVIQHKPSVSKKQGKSGNR